MDNNTTPMARIQPVSNYYGPAQTQAPATVSSQPYILNVTIAASQQPGFVTVTWDSSSATSRAFTIRVIEPTTGAWIGPEVIVTEGGVGHALEYNMAGAPANNYQAQVYYGTINDGNSTFSSAAVTAYAG